MRRSRLVSIACAVFCAAFAASSPAAIVWDLNPNDQHGSVGSNSHTFTNSGFSITAYGFDNNAGIGTAHDLFFKHENIINGAVESGLGLTNVSHNELQPNLHFIQFDFTAALAAGMMNGQISVGSVQPGELFAFYGSNSLGTLGTQITPALGSSFDNQFVAIPGFGQFLYYSVVALADDVIPVAIQADIPAIPEMSTLLPIAGLLLLVFAVEVRRRRSARA
ncbi:MAG TPA: hypothetical protein VM940_07165 [Chthoniobacterales bacterium]|jgi:hypothetical protein|nr:hypothetical protein [Chthoniobacterales bacterium]